MQTSGNQFDAAGAILKSLAGLKVDLRVDSSIKLDDCTSRIIIVLVLFKY